MITHVALYRFRPGTTKEQIERLAQEVAARANKTGLVIRASGGPHVSLSADEPMHDMVYDYAALWVFANQKNLDEFSQHPLMKECVATYIRPVLEKLAIVNFASAE